VTGKKRRTRGAGELFVENGRWAARWREGGRRRYKGGFPTRALAERHLVAQLVGAAERAALDERPNPPLAGAGTAAQGDEAAAAPRARGRGRRAPGFSAQRESRWSRPSR
jgi:hypothetical protein